MKGAQYHCQDLMNFIFQLPLWISSIAWDMRYVIGNGMQHTHMRGVSLLRRGNPTHYRVFVTISPLAVLYANPDTNGTKELGVVFKYLVKALFLGKE